MSAWYDKTKTVIGSGGLDLTSLSDPKMIAIEEGLYTFSQGHQFLSDVPVGARLATVDLTSVTFGVSLESYLDADNPTFLTPPVGTVAAYIVYNDTAVEATSPLIVYIDSGVGLPITIESGRDLQVEFNANGVAKL